MKDGEGLVITLPLAFFSVNSPIALGLFFIPAWAARGRHCTVASHQFSVARVSLFQLVDCSVTLYIGAFDILEDLELGSRFTFSLLCG